MIHSHTAYSKSTFNSSPDSSHLSTAARKPDRLWRVPHTASRGNTCRHTAFTKSHTSSTGLHSDRKSMSVEGRGSALGGVGVGREVFDTGLFL
jgi:hypothetical protein